jgi:hypothetical protein
MKTARPSDRVGLIGVCAAVACVLLAACAAPAGTATAPMPATAIKPSASTTDAVPPPADIAGAITSPAHAKSGAPAAGVVDLSCKTDDDCAIKDVGSCCGYHPQCVNIASPTFPDQVKSACAAENRAGVCGFPSIAACQCVAGKCAASEGPAAQGNLK